MTGKYVCALTDMNYSSNHAVGIDCDYNLKNISDCCKETSLYLIHDNMNKFVGVGEILQIFHQIMV